MFNCLYLLKFDPQKWIKVDWLTVILKKADWPRVHLLNDDWLKVNMKKKCPKSALTEI